MFDIYLFLMVQSDELQALLGALGLPIIPVNNEGAPITLADMLDYRLDRESGTDGVQEIKEWMAFLTFLTADVTAGGFEDHIIPDAAYGADALAAGDGSRVTVISLAP